MSNSFGIFLQCLVEKQEKSWIRLLKVALTMVEQTAEKELLELNWVPEINSNKNRFEGWFLNFFEDFKSNFEEHSKKIETFEDLKNLLISLAKRRLNNLFAEFIKALRAGDEKSWKLLNNESNTRMVYWIVKQSGLTAAEAKCVYQEGLSLLYEKLTSEKLIFENSKKLKSYLIKILENKMKEYLRIKYKQEKQIDIENVRELDLPFGLNADDNMDEEQVQIIKDQLLKLDETERLILIKSLYDELKLKTIAKELGITEENCRVIKFRALKKLKDIFKNQLNFTIGL